MVHLRRLGGVKAWSTRRTVIAAKLVVAATLAWIIAADGLQEPIPVLAPIAALLTIQGSVYATVRQGFSVSAGVLLGAAVGFGLGRAAGNRWWVIAAAVAIGLAVRELPYLRESSSTQVPISALLVVALGESYGYDRVVDTAIGCAMGIVVNVTVLPPVRTDEATRALQQAARNMVDLLRDMARGLGQGWERNSALEWLGRARRSEVDLEHVRHKLREGEQSLRWNPQQGHRRGLPRQRVAAEALDHVTGAVRSIARDLADLASDGRRRPVEPPTLAAYDALIACCADAVEAFGRIVGGDASATGDVEAAITAGRDRAGEVAEAVHTVSLGARRERLVAALIEEAERLLGELAPDAAHRDAYPSGQ